MKSSRTAVLLVLFFAFLVKAEEPDYQKNLRVVAYLHPIPLFLGAANDIFMFNSTVEVPLNLNSSVIVQPAVWLGSSDGSILGVEYEKLVRFGTGIGLRRYAMDKGYGFYLQTIAGVYYFSADKVDDEEKWSKVKGAVYELMLYAGSSHKWQNVSFFYELGMGFGYDGSDSKQLGYVNKLVASFNLGLGIPL